MSWTQSDRLSKVVIRSISTFSVFEHAFSREEIKMHLFKAIITLNFSICYSFQSLDDLENFYKSDPVFDPLGLSGKI